MLGHRSRLTLLALTAVAACDTTLETPPLGSMDLTTSAPTIEREVVTSDGWTLEYDRFLVHVAEVSVTGADGVVAASESNRLVDQVVPPPKSLLSAPLRTARAWEDVKLQIGPTAEDASFEPPVTEADRDAMAKSGASLLVEGKLTKAGVVKSFRWTFATATAYRDCREDRGGSVVRGLVVPPDGNDTADLVMAGDVLFSDDLAAGVPRAEGIAAADTNNDGAVTLDELRAVPLDVARAAGAPYATADRTDVADLGAFVEAQTRRLVTRFRANGTCTAESP